MFASGAGFAGLFIFSSLCLSLSCCLSKPLKFVQMAAPKVPNIPPEVKNGKKKKPAGFRHFLEEGGIEADPDSLPVVFQWNPPGGSKLLNPTKKEWVAEVLSPWAKGGVEPTSGTGGLSP